MLPTKVMAVAKLLVADDDHDMLFLIELVLTAAGHTVLPVSNGEEALAALRRGGVDLTIVDVQMPKMCGLDVTRLVRADPDLASLPVMVLTADASEEGRAAGYSAGADDYLVKPFALADLKARVDALLAEQQVAPALALVAS
jgi:DNA-binding response OmpR family regulator